MTLYDYYEPEKYHQITYDCSQDIRSKRGIDNPIDGFIKLLDLSQTDEEFKQKYPIDTKGCLFYLLTKYATSKKDRKIIINMPQVEHFKIDKDTNYICTIFGETKFRLYIKNPLDILIKYLETDTKKIKILKELYDGKLYQYCHYTAAELAKNYNVISAFVPGKFKNHRYIHSYLEKDNIIYDVSNNLVMIKDDYYKLLTPEEVLKLKGEELYKIENRDIEDVYIDYLEKTLKKR